MPIVEADEHAASRALPISNAAPSAVKGGIGRLLSRPWCSVYVADDEGSMRTRSPRSDLSSNSHERVRHSPGDADPSGRRRAQDGQGRASRLGGRRVCRRRGLGRRRRVAPGALRGFRRDRVGRDAPRSRRVRCLSRAANEGPMGAGVDAHCSRWGGGSDPRARRGRRRLPREAVLLRRAPGPAARARASRCDRATDDDDDRRCGAGSGDAHGHPRRGADRS